MTFREFALIASQLPAQPHRGRARRTDLRAVVDGIFYLLQNGCPWTNLPRDFQPKSMVCWYLRRFYENGVWAHIHDALYVDFRDLQGRGVHSAGNQERDGAERLFEHLTARFHLLNVIIGDGGYAGSIIRVVAPRPVKMVNRSDQARGFEVLPMRWMVERTLTWLTINHRFVGEFER